MSILSKEFKNNVVMYEESRTKWQEAQETFEIAQAKFKYAENIFKNAHQEYVNAAINWQTANSQYMAMWANVNAPVTPNDPIAQKR